MSISISRCERPQHEQEVRRRDDVVAGLGQSSVPNFRELLRSCDLAAILQLIRAVDPLEERQVADLVVQVRDHDSRDAWQGLMEMASFYSSSVPRFVFAGLRKLACDARRDVALRSVNFLALHAPHSGNAIQQLGLVLSEACDPGVFCVAFRTLNGLAANRDPSLDPENLFDSAKMFLERNHFSNAGRLAAVRDFESVESLVNNFAVLADDYRNASARQVLEQWDITTLREIAESNGLNARLAKDVLKKLMDRGHLAACTFLEQISSAQHRFAALLGTDDTITEQIRALEMSFKNTWEQRIRRVRGVSEDAVLAEVNRCWSDFLAVYLPEGLIPAEREARRKILVLVHLIDGELNRALGSEPLIGRVIARWRDGNIVAAKLPVFVDHLIKKYDAYECRRGNAQPLGSTTLTDFAYTLLPDGVPEGWEWDNGI